jgi:hypothetical protein
VTVPDDGPDAASITFSSRTRTKRRGKYAMNYKTVVLELLEQDQDRYERLRQRRLLATLNALAEELRSRHHHWMDALRPTRRDSDPAQLSTEAMELALSDLRERLRHESAAEA